MMIETLMELLFSFIAVFWASRLGRDAVAIIGLTESVMTLIHAVAIGLTLAAAAVVSRKIAEKNSERPAQSAAQVVML